jgi:hypothetical protein
VDAWVATADPASGSPYLVPLSFLWDGQRLLVATPSASPTSRHLQATSKVRLGIGPTRDLVVIEGTVQPLAAAEVPDQVGDGFAAKTGFDPRQLTDPTWTFGSSLGGCRRGARPTSWPDASSCAMDTGWSPTEGMMQARPGPTDRGAGSLPFRAPPGPARQGRGLRPIGHDRPQPGDNPWDAIQLAACHSD